MMMNTPGKSLEARAKGGYGAWDEIVQMWAVLGGANRNYSYPRIGFRCHR